MAATVVPTEDFTKPEQLGFDEKDQSDSGKFKFLLGLVKKLVGVSDIINLRLSLPSQVLDPIPNLEHFNWLDRPDYFAAMGSPADPLGRMINVLKYSFSKEISKAKYRIKKPYNSILGEHFLCSWDVALPEESDKKVKVTMLNEQTSHHPPVSAFWLGCKETGVVARGCDHLSAKFTGTSIKVIPGELGKGIYITLSHHDNEEYHISHCNAYIQGWLTGTLYLALQDRVVISCSKSQIRVIYDFKPERWVGKARHAVEGIIFKYTPTYEQGFASHSDMPPDNLRLSDIPKADILAEISGSYKDKILITRACGKEKEVLIDMGSLDSVPNSVKPIDQMDELESHRVWQDVTENILAKNFSQATKAKLAIEDAQRARAKARAENGEATWQPKYFKVLPKDREHCPELLDDAKPIY
ncbi:hypothetical protein DSO57_1004962 [Entomophthora muscae]|uniref:Uncharacterized protein n=1 Tax=Entomophthora muscae TaxID=34485 RepID=A0ACC2U6E7_9FUNG|nr:hypothetical protein DSO57_1004962 [Entomophthora muscae]